MPATTPNQALRRRRLIAARLFIAGIRQADIARSADVSRGLVCHVVSGRRRNAAVEQALARACGMGVAELWED